MELETSQKNIENLRNEHLQHLAEFTEIKNERAKAEKEYELISRQQEKLQSQAKNEEYLEMAKRSFDYLMQNFWDNQYGGAYWMLDHTGKSIDDIKELYGHSFLIYGLTEYHFTTGDNAALEKAKELFFLIEKHCHDDVNKGYYETFKRDWSATEKAMLAFGDIKGKKTMNTHLHLLEAYRGMEALG